MTEPEDDEEWKKPAEIEREREREREREKGKGDKKLRHRPILS